MIGKKDHLEPIKKSTEMIFHNPKSHSSSKIVCKIQAYKMLKLHQNKKNLTTFCLMFHGSITELNKSHANSVTLNIAGDDRRLYTQPPCTSAKYLKYGIKSDTKKKMCKSFQDD